MEYVFILGFLVALVFFWKLLHRTGESARFDADQGNLVQRDFKQCILPQNLYYHQGHSWVEQKGADVVKIGIDDFAQKLIGQTDLIDLPRVGTLLEQGEKGWKLGRNSSSIDILSPVDGEVLAVNEKALSEPQIINRDPYGNGWLLKVRVSKMKSNMTNLLSGHLAAVWMKENIEAFCLKLSEDASPAEQAVPEPGNETSEKSLRDRVHELAKEFLLCK